MFAHLPLARNLQMPTALSQNSETSISIRACLRAFIITDEHRAERAEWLPGEAARNATICTKSSTVFDIRFVLSQQAYHFLLKVLKRVFIYIKVIAVSDLISPAKQAFVQEFEFRLIARRIHAYSTNDVLKDFSA
jgi:hypothetical protein